MSSFRIFFVSDLHGSTRCFRKLLNSVKTSKRPDVLIIGGDITGKYFVPVTGPHTSGRHFRAYLPDGSIREIPTQTDLENFENRASELGTYTFVVTPDDYKRYAHVAKWREEMRKKVIARRLEEWLSLVDQRLPQDVRLVINCGNDDPSFVDALLEKHARVEFAEGRAIPLPNGLELISCGYSNLTPFGCPRDVPEVDLDARIAEVANSATVPFTNTIFNLHCPPFNTKLDQAIKIDAKLVPIMGPSGPLVSSVGSSSVFAAIKNYQPVLSLHGHIHESPGHCRIGETHCYNPGSEYSEGRLNGVVAEFEGTKLVAHYLTREDVPAKRPSDVRILINALLRKFGFEEVMDARQEQQAERIKDLEAQLNASSEDAESLTSENSRLTLELDGLKKENQELRKQHAHVISKYKELKAVSAKPLKKPGEEQ
jgi:Icc-related predicted phosphoesterase